MLIEKIVEIENKYRKVQKEVQAFLKNVPEGNIRQRIISSKVYYYVAKEGAATDKHLSKKNPADLKLIKVLCQKRYCNKLAAALEENIKAMGIAKNALNITNPEEVFDNLPEGIKEYVNPYLLSNMEFAKNWEQETYRKSTYAPSTAVYETDKGDKVRSKTEVIIANKLFNKGIPYKYEKVYFIPEYGEFAPDFTILNVRTQQVFIWEHFGIMGSAEYRSNAMRKIEMYTEYERRTGIRFIATFEDEYKSITTSHINDVINNNLV